MLVQDPYDAQNPVLTIPHWYYSEKIRKIANRIVYIPPFLGDDFEPEARNDVYNLKHCVLKPGVVWADLVILPTETLRQRWLEKLTEWAGEDTAGYWEQKLICEDVSDEGYHEENEEPCQVNDNSIHALNESSDQSEKPDKTEIGKTSCQDDAKIIPNDHTKKLLWCIGAHILTEEPTSALDALQQRIKTIKKAAESLQTDVYFYPEDKEQWHLIDAKLADEIFNLFTENSLGTDSAGRIVVVNELRESISNMLHIDDYDAYYGSPSPLIVEFSRHKKPVMLADYDVMEH